MNPISLQTTGHLRQLTADTVHARSGRRADGIGGSMDWSPVAAGLSGSTDRGAVAQTAVAADRVIVPMETEPLCFDPTARTINKVIRPRGIPYIVVINNWETRDGQRDLEETKEFVRGNGWPLAHTVIRHYKLHARASADGQVVTEYATNGVSLRAREDFYRLALELNVGGVS